MRAGRKEETDLVVLGLVGGVDTSGEVARGVLGEIKGGEETVSVEGEERS